MASSSEQAPLLPGSLRASLAAWLRGMLGYTLMVACLAASASLLTWSAADPSYIRTASGPIRNALGGVGANLSDLAMRMFGLAAVVIILPPTFWALELITRRRLEDARLKLTLAPAALLLIASSVSALPAPVAWPLPYGLGGLLGDQSLRFLASLLTVAAPGYATATVGAFCLLGGLILLTGSLGMSMQDLVLIYRGQRPRSSLAARAWRGLSRAFERPEQVDIDRREPILELPPRAITVGSQRAFHVAPPYVEPPYVEPPYVESNDEPEPAPPPRRPESRWQMRKPKPQPRVQVDEEPSEEFDETTDDRSHDMARRFAPKRGDAPGGFGFGLFRRRGAGPAGPSSAPKQSRVAPSKPIWPGSVPVPADEDMPVAEHVVRPAGDALYGRAVALVRAQRKASAAYLQQSLGIGYMRAADLIDRMEREGIVGAPVHNGIRPILTPPRGARIV